MAKELAVGMKAPEFSLPDQDGKTVTLKSLKDKQVVLYFYPKDDTSGCTKESCGFRDAMASIKKAGAVVIGVSFDGQASHQKFIAKYALPFTLLSDLEKGVATAYDVYKEKSMYGRKYMGIERSTFVIDAEGKLKAIFRKVKVDGHVDEVLAALRASCLCERSCATGSAPPVSSPLPSSSVLLVLPMRREPLRQRSSLPTVCRHPIRR